jgi:hypothetical protein
VHRGISRAIRRAVRQDLHPATFVLVLSHVPVWRRCDCLSAGSSSLDEPPRVPCDGSLWPYPRAVLLCLGCRLHSMPHGAEPRMYPVSRCHLLLCPAGERSMRAAGVRTVLLAPGRDAVSRARPREPRTVHFFGVLSRLDPDRNILHEANDVRAEKSSAREHRARWMTVGMDAPVASCPFRLSRPWIQPKECAA